MIGQVLDYSIQSNSGIISGADGERYTFVGAEWKGDCEPVRGMAVDFDVQGRNAVAIYRGLERPGFGAVPEAKSKVAAGLLAFLLGMFGVHKFYLGYVGPGLVFLLVNTIGFVVTVFMLGIPNLVLFIIAIVEGVIYLTRSDEDFEQTYVYGRKSWF